VETGLAGLRPPPLLKSKILAFERSLPGLFAISEPCLQGAKGARSVPGFCWRPGRVVLVVGDRPLKIASDRFVHRLCVMAAHHGHVMLEPVPRDVAKERPKSGDLADGDPSVHRKGIVGERALADIGFDRPFSRRPA